MEIMAIFTLEAPSQPASGSIYIFLPNGTLLETSCAETYRIAKWSANPKDPKALTVVEDGQSAFTAKIVELTRTTLWLQKKFVRSSEQQDVRFTAIEKEFVCPDLPK